MDKIVLIKNRMLREIMGISLLAASIFIFISLISYYHGDPSFNRVVTSEVVVNYGGIVGAYVSDLLLVSLGVGAFFVPLLTFILSIHFILKSGIKNLLLKLLYLLMILLSVLVILGMVFGSKKVLFGDVIYAGGLFGLTLSIILKGFLNTAGAFIVSLLVLTLFVILLFGTTISDVSNLIARFISRIFNIFKRAFKFITGGGRKSPRRDRPKVRSGKPARERDMDVETKSSPRIIDARSQRGVSSDLSLKRPSHSDLGIGTKEYIFPPLDLLEPGDGEAALADRKSLIELARFLEKKLLDFGVKGNVTEVRPGPVITMFEFEPASGQRINKIAGLADDIAMAMSALSVRIVAPIPGRAVVGFEIPNPTREIVKLRDIVECDKFSESKSMLTFAVGKDIFGAPVVSDLSRMPHLMVAGATGAGKSVCINSMIISILYKASFNDVKLLLIDPKMLELSLYRGIPHLLLPVVTDPKKAQVALRWVVEEMERRYRVMADLGVKNISGYNIKIKKEKKRSDEISGDGTDEAPSHMPYVVVIIDELSDLMMTSSREVEESITRLAHMARASGIHLIVATQRPSVNVLTGVIKANFPARISFQVSSRVDSRTILDTSGAEHLLGEGDMLFLPPTSSKLIRVHGAYVSEEEILRVVDFVKDQASPEYEKVDLSVDVDVTRGLDDEYDEKYDDAVAFVAQTGKASISLVQRHLRIGYNRAARIIEKMEEEGIVGPSDGVRPREVLINKI